MIRIKTFVTPKTTGSSASTSESTTSTTIVQSEADKWFYYDSDNGVVSCKYDFNSVGNINADGDFNGTNMTLTDDLTCDDISCNDINSSGDITTNDVHCNDVISSGDVRTTDLHCANVNCTNNVITNNIEANTGTITNLVAEYLTVTKQAHFFELIIDKIKANSGQVILSAANAIVEKVTPVTDGYKLYWRCEDTETNKKISNDFVYQDQVRCQTFNVHEGTNFNVDNKYYWRLVTDTGTETVEIDGEQVECNYIEVSDIDKDGSSIPDVGDEIVQLGNRTDATRQNAIILSACTSPDPNVTAPSIVQYSGINSYSLNNKILNQMAANGNTFTGNFMVVNGNTVDNVLNLITGNQPIIKTDTDAAFLMANTASELTSIDDAQNLPTNITLYDGSNIIDYSTWTTNSYIRNDWQTVPLKPASTYSETGLYISEISSDNAGGCYVDWNFVQDGSLYTNYQIEIYIEWNDGQTLKHVTKTVPVNVLIQTNAPAGADGEFDRLQIMTGDATVSVNDTLTVAFIAQVQHVKGDTVSILTNLSEYSMNVMYNNNAGSYVATKDVANNRFVFTDTITNFSAQQAIPTNISFTLIKGNGLQTIMADNYIIDIKFNAGSIFEVKEDAITAAVTASNGYTDAEIAIVNLNAQGLTSRVTAIEGDYVTQSVLTQTANNITMNVYDELRNSTGIDIQTGQITLNANNTVINGNLNLNKTDNGIVVYDSDGTARIQIQPKNIGNIADFDGGTEYYVTSSITDSNKSNYSLTTEKQKIGTFSAGNTMKMKNLHCFMKSWNNQTQETPTPGSVSVTIKLYKEGNNSAVKSFNRSFAYNSTTNEYTTNDISYNIPSDGVYLFNATFSYSATPLTNIYEEVFAIIEQTVFHQTYIGADGMYCNPYHNAMLWAGSDAIVMRWNDDGIRADNNGLKRTPQHIMQNEPDWLPFDNYTRVTTLNSNQYSLSNNQYNYEIMPLYSLGIISSECPSFNYSNRTTHLKLPPYSFYSIGVNYMLPVGYKVSVVNKDALASTSSLTTNKYIIVDDNSLGRSWNVGSRMITFVHLGGGIWAPS